MTTKLFEELDILRQQWESEKSGLGDVQDIRHQQAELELEFEQLDAAIKEKAATGAVVSEEEYQRLYELDVRRKELLQQQDALDARERTPRKAM